MEFFYLVSAFLNGATCGIAERDRPLLFFYYYYVILQHFTQSEHIYSFFYIVYIIARFYSILHFYKFVLMCFYYVKLLLFKQ